MSITKQQLKQLIKEEIFKLQEVGYIPGEPGSEEHEVGLKDWASGFTGDPNDPLPSTGAKRSADLEAAKTLVSAMDPEELEQLQQHISDSLTEPEEVEALDLSAAAKNVGDITASPGINKDLGRLKRRAKRTVGGGR
jgi:hypothetical protein